MKPLLTSEEIAKFLGIPRTSVWYYVRGGVLPHYRIGRAVRFDLDTVRAALINNEEVAKCNNS